jgi:uncharacterized radical SAM superfamily Fe-S cluster-containing enzyme
LYAFKHGRSFGSCLKPCVCNSQDAKQERWQQEEDAKIMQFQEWEKAQEASQAKADDAAKLKAAQDAKAKIVEAARQKYREEKQVMELNVLNLIERIHASFPQKVRPT